MATILKRTDIVDVTCREKTLYFQNTEIKVNYTYNILQIKIIGTGNPEYFQIHVTPTNNCQVMSIAGFNTLLGYVLLYTHRDSDSNTIEVSKEDRIAMLKEIFFEIREAVWDFGYNFKQILIDLNEDMVQYITDEEFNLKPFTVFSIDYISTNDSKMYMALINFRKLLNSWEHKTVLEEKPTADILTVTIE